MSGYPNDNKVIAKNTAFLYGRTLFAMTLSLFTSRIILSAVLFRCATSFRHP